MTVENILYKDLDLSLTQHPVSGDIIPLTNAAAVKRSIRHLFMLDKYDIPFNNTTYSVVKRQLFEPITKVTEGNIQTLVTWLVETYEPRAKLEKVEVRANSSEDGYDITLYFKILSLNTDEQMNILLKRVR
jgi:phage baseplate assembly protein W